MYGHQRNSGIPLINDYATALKLWEDTKPIRGRAVDTRPLGHRRNDHYLINFLPEGAVECILYKTPVVTFYENGGVTLRHDGWNSVSTCNFIGEVLGLHSSIFNYKTLVGFGGKDYIVPAEGLTIKRNDDWVYEPVNPTPVIGHALDRKGANNVRSLYKPFNSYLSSMCRLKAGSDYPQSELCRVFGEVNLDGKYSRPKMPADLSHEERSGWEDSVKDFFKLIADTKEETRNDSFYKAILQMAYSFGITKWVNGGETEGYVLHEKKALKAFDELIIGFHRSETLIEKVLPEGVVRKDSYGKYFRGGWKRVHNK
jgi:hypothetical protein